MNERQILISGAGIAGPALAYWLRRYGFRPVVVERAPAPRPGGYKVDIRGVAVEVIARMGLLDAVRRQATAIRGGALINAAGKTVATLSGDQIGFRDPGDLEIMRGDLATLLHDATRADVEYIYGDAITSLVEEADGVLVAFEHGPARTFDLVVGADGVHSAVRALAFGPEERFAHALGLDVAVYSIPNYLGLDRWELAYSSAGHVANVYSVRQAAEAKALFFFPAMPGDVARRDLVGQRRAVAEAFAGLGWEIPRLLEALPTAPDLYYDSLIQIRMDRWTAGRVALLGDAAYCPSPASGQGTSLALVGAYVLAGALAAAEGDHQAAFATYERELRPFVELNQRLGRDIVKQLVPATRWQAWSRTQLMRLLPYLPGKEKMMDKYVMGPIREAANGIALPQPAR